MNTNSNPRMNDSEDTVLDGNAAQTTAHAGRGIWKKCLIGGVPGIVLGGAGTLAGSSLAAAEPESEENPEENSEENSEAGQTSGAAIPEIADTVSVAGSVTDDMTFAEAFAAARAELGAGGVFTWHGNVYGTYMQDEWDAMSDEQRQEYAEAVSSTHVHPEPYSPVADEEPVVITEPVDDGGSNTVASNGGAAAPGNGGETNTVTSNGDETNTVASNGGETNTDNNEEITQNGPGNAPGDDGTGTNEGDEVDVHVLDVVQADNGNGGTAYVGIAEIDGHYAEYQDLDGNGVVDQLVVDLNDNEAADEGEVFSAEGANIQVSDLAAAAAYEQQPMPDDDLYAHTPDYTNDADTDSFA